MKMSVQICRRLPLNSTIGKEWGKSRSFLVLILSACSWDCQFPLSLYYFWMTSLRAPASMECQSSLPINRLVKLSWSSVNSTSFCPTLWFQLQCTWFLWRDWAVKINRFISILGWLMNTETAMMKMPSLKRMRQRVDSLRCWTAECRMNIRRWESPNPDCTVCLYIIYV